MARIPLATGDSRVRGLVRHLADNQADYKKDEPSKLGGGQT